ncbi:MAG: aromatic acid exporter family protein [Eubacteriales bacterium]|nr:aromatic acid exporter family protein [Eubacteriales bacterium]
MERPDIQPATLQRIRYHIGMRNIKTAISATICAMIYLALGRNPTFACIGAIFGLGYDMSNSRLNGGNRFFGTIFGGLIGMGLFRIYIIFYPQGGFHALMLLLLFVGVILLILASQLFRWPGAIQPGGVMLCILLFNQPVDSYVAYSLNRILDTGIGVLCALLVNFLLPRERVLRWMEKWNARRHA